MRKILINQWYKKMCAIHRVPHTPKNMKNKNIL